MIVKLKNSEIYPKLMFREFTLEDSLSKAGGIIGLLAGASMLSIIEFLYFFTIRMAPLLMTFHKRLFKISSKKKHKIIFVKSSESF
jgi:hypothetical protein